MKRIYLDYAATTPLDPRVEKAMQSLVRKAFGNPSSIHAEGVAAKKALDRARTAVARCLEAHAEEVVFTSGGTESNNLAIFGVLEAVDTRCLKSLTSGVGRLPHIVTTNIEHASGLEPLRQLEREGKAEVTYVPVEQNGIVKPGEIIAAIKPNTALVSVMYANNEIGTIQPIRKIGQLLSAVRDSKFSILNSPNERRYPVFHSDACQAPSYLPCLVNALGVDLLSLDAHKIYGPKGVGALYVRPGTMLSPQLLGGGQERGHRSATENVPGIVGFAEALHSASENRKKESERIKKLRDALYSSILQNNGIVIMNGSMKEGERLPNNLNISLPGIDTEFLTLQLDAAGIAVSTKSSCLKNEKESYVISAIASRDKARARSTLRFTLGRGTTSDDIKRVAEAVNNLLKSK